MATIDFSVGISPGTLTGFVNGQNDYVGVYQAQNVVGATLATNDIFCVSPTSNAITSSASYVIQSGVVGQSPGFSLTQANAIEGIISNYYDNTLGTPTDGATAALAVWYVADPSLTFSGNGAVQTAAQAEAHTALLGGLTVDSSLGFQTFVNANSQNFVNVYPNTGNHVVPTPLPGSLVLLVSAIVLTLAVKFGQKYLARTSMQAAA
jgi:hypothetical protein